MVESSVVVKHRLTPSSSVSSDPLFSTVTRRPSSSTETDRGRLSSSGRLSLDKKDESIINSSLPSAASEDKNETVAAAKMDIDDDDLVLRCLPSYPLLEVSIRGVPSSLLCNEISSGELHIVNRGLADAGGVVIKTAIPFLYIDVEGVELLGALTQA